MKMSKEETEAHVSNILEHHEYLVKDKATTIILHYVDNEGWIVTDLLYGKFCISMGFRGDFEHARRFFNLKAESIINGGTIR